MTETVLLPRDLYERIVSLVSSSDHPDAGLVQQELTDFLPPRMELEPPSDADCDPPPEPSEHVRELTARADAQRACLERVRYGQAGLSLEDREDICLYELPPDRDLDRDIWTLFLATEPPTPLCEGEEPIYWHAPEPHRKRPAPRLTESLDAVCLLAPIISENDENTTPLDILSDGIETMERLGRQSSLPQTQQLARYCLAQILERQLSITLLDLADCCRVEGCPHPTQHFERNSHNGWTPIW